MNESDYKTLAIENGNTANLLAERLRIAEQRLAQADAEVKRQDATIHQLRADMQSMVHHNCQLANENGQYRTQPSISELLRLVRTGEIDLSIHISKHPDSGCAFRDERLPWGEE